MLNKQELITKWIENSNYGNDTYFKIIEANRDEILNSNRWDENINEINNLIERKWDNNNTRNCASAAFRSLLDYIYPYNNNSKALKRYTHQFNNEIRALSQDELKTVIELLEKYKLIRSKHYNKFYHHFYALLSSGMRAGELCRLDFDKIDVTIKEHRVMFKITTEKTNRERLTSIYLENYEYLKENGIWGYKMLSNEFVKFNKWLIDKNVLLPHITPHMLRKTFAVKARLNGISIDDISDMLGNTSIVCKTYYAKSTDLNINKFLMSDFKITEGLKITDLQEQCNNLKMILIEYENEINILKDKLSRYENRS